MECHSLHSSPDGLSVAVKRCPDELPHVTKDNGVTGDFHQSLKLKVKRKRARDSITNEAVPSLQDADCRDCSSPSVDMESQDIDTAGQREECNVMDTPSNSSTFAASFASDHAIGLALRDGASPSHAQGDLPSTTPQSLDSSLVFLNEESWPFEHMSFLDSDVTTGHLPTPKPNVSVKDKSLCIISQPMIASPAPTPLLPTQAASGKVFPCQLYDKTPLGEKSFHPNIFSASSLVSDIDLCNHIDYAFHSHAVQVSNTVAVKINQSSNTLNLNDARDRLKTYTHKIVSHSYYHEQLVPVMSTSESHTTALSRGIVLNSRPRRAKMTKVDPPSDLDVEKGSDEKDDNAEVMCTCRKTNCLKLYCVCFQRGLICDKAICKCTNCKNSKKESGPKGARTKAVQLIVRRRPDAFGVRVKVPGLGCSCKRNRCLKKYCHCYAEGDLCSDKCSCNNCHNCEV